MKKRRFLRGLGITLLVLLFIVLVGPFLVPVPPAEGTRPFSELADPDSKFVEINNLNIHYKVMGQGEPVFVLLHGFGASLYSWHAVMEPLSQIGTVIAYDRPAFGLTERPMTWTGTNPYSSQANIELLLGLLDHFNIEKAILVGNSAGGTVSMQFALQYPERVQALILVDPAVYNGGGGPSWLRLLYRAPQMQHLGPLVVRSIQSRGLEIIKMAWHDPSRITQETFDGYTRPLHAENWDRALWYFTLASEDPSLINHLKDFSVPILVITGDDDRIVPTANSVRLARELPNAQLAVIREAGHVPQEEQPAAFMQAVMEFLPTLK